MRRFYEVIDDLGLRDIHLKGGPFKDLLKNWWQSLQFSGSPSYVLAAKLKVLKAILKSWNRDVFGRVEATLGRLGCGMRLSRPDLCL